MRDISHGRYNTIKPVLSQLCVYQEYYTAITMVTEYTFRGFLYYKRYLEAKCHDIGTICLSQTDPSLILGSGKENGGSQLLN